MAFTAQAPAIYASALLQQVNGERPLIQPIKPKPKKHITAILTAIERTCNGIILIPCLLTISLESEIAENTGCSMPDARCSPRIEKRIFSLNSQYSIVKNQLLITLPPANLPKQGQAVPVLQILSSSAGWIWFQWVQLRFQARSRHKL